ncbi:4'-phosphopantetheinyl transferase superfamily protein [Variovorax sp. DXTD-1]|uniref:4'-phosphopantetheinyl transferase family protein n=1 Tax=Variovorax sp. DXTD-1 TaxID=2495592 RepID=UPI0021AF193A|nr:4'-phosphopantetheinyl transferase superfamily protein [Variovorax sp. DXTD-1]
MSWPDPLPAGIEVYRLDLDLDADVSHERQVLAFAERAQADRFARGADRVRFTAARAALRRLLATRIGCHPAEVPLATGLHRKPFLDVAGGDAPLFNVSHSGAHALIALGDPRVVSEVGIDIEACRSDVDVEAVTSLAFTDSERRALQQTADPLQALYSRWVGKEAVLKAVGVGVAEHLQSIGIHSGVHGRYVLECTVPEWSGLQAVALHAPAGYAAALAWRAKEST